MTMKPTVTIYEFKIDTARIAEALYVPEALVVEAFGDGRVASRWSEHWGARVADLHKAQNTNNAGFDLSTRVSSADISVSSKCLSHAGVKFQESKYQGSGRTCTVDDLLDSLEKVELFQITDITLIPTVRIMTVHSRFLREEVRERRLGPTGWKANSFYNFLHRTYDTEVAQVTP